jgi:hypothetical protein
VWLGGDSPFPAFIKNSRVFAGFIRVLVHCTVLCVDGMFGSPGSAAPTLLPPD